MKKNLILLSWICTTLLFLTANAAIKLHPLKQAETIHYTCRVCSNTNTENCDPVKGTSVFTIDNLGSIPNATILQAMIDHAGDYGHHKFYPYRIFYRLPARYVSDIGPVSGYRFMYYEQHQRDSDCGALWMLAAFCYPESDVLPAPTVAAHRRNHH